MQTTKKKGQVEKLALMALLTALVAVLAYFGGFIKIGPASINLTLVPVVLGAAMYGPWAGAWLGLVSGAIFFTTPDATFWLGMSVPGTIATVLIKGMLAGLFAGLIYTGLKKFNKYVAVIMSAIVCPVVNTGIFLVGCRIFFWDYVVGEASNGGQSVFAFIIIAFVGLNFVFELGANLILGPTIYSLINIKKKI